VFCFNGSDLDYFSMITMRSVKEGFTLIEILIVVAIIAILSGAILTSLSGQREKANVNKVLTEISARLQPMMMCWSDGLSVDSTPGDGEDNVCTTNANYGLWPTLPSGFSYAGSIVTATNWYIRIDGGSARICCNSATSQCGVLPLATDTCNATTPGSF